MFLRTLPIFALLALTACGPKSAAPGTATPPAGLVPLNQMLEFADSSETSQGTGFLAHTPSGAIVGVTSAHFLNQQGPRLQRVTLTTRETESPVTTAVQSLGRPGKGPITSGSTQDLRSDYLILIPDASVTPASARGGAAVLTLDTRESVPTGERIWFPFCDYANNAPQRLIEGAVITSSTGGLSVRLDEAVHLTCESGSPIVSQTTGLVIGTLSGAQEAEGHTVVWLAPACAIYNAMVDAENAKVHMRLEDGVGR